MRILIDAMGGDNAPEAVVRGAAAAAAEFGVDVVLIGQEERIRSVLSAAQVPEGGRVSVVDAPEVITMEDDPATAVRRKKNASMSVMLQMLSRGEGDAAISAGSTGALLSGATLTVRRIPGVRRACFAPVIPNGGKGLLLADCGANSECTPEYLLQFAYLADIYAREVMGIASPRIALLNIGAEDSKGGELQKQTFALLKAEKEAGRLNFVGNLESSAIFSGEADVAVADGFAGNVLLKSIEGTAKFLMSRLKAAMTKNTKNKLAALALRDDLAALKGMLDASEVGGTPLLGLRRCVIKAHGSSDERAIRSAVLQAVRCAERDVTGIIEKNISFMRIEKTQEGE